MCKSIKYFPHAQIIHKQNNKPQKKCNDIQTLYAFCRYYNPCDLSLRKPIHTLPKGSMKHSKNPVYFHIRDWDDVGKLQIAM